MGQTVKQFRSHLCVVEHTDSFTETEVGGDHHRNVLVEFLYHVEQQMASGVLFVLQLVDRVHDIVKLPSCAVSDPGSGRPATARFGLAGGADQNHVARLYSTCSGYLGLITASSCTSFALAKSTGAMNPLGLCGT